jgi:hypothetical protein
MSLRDLKEVRTKLPPEGQKWLDGMDHGELEDTQGILHRVGEQQFLESWKVYKKDLDDFRREFGGPYGKGWFKEYHL